MFGDVVGLAGDFFAVADEPIVEGRNDQEKEQRFINAFNNLFNEKSLTTAFDILKISEGPHSFSQEIKLTYACLDMGAIMSGNSPIPYASISLNNIDHFSPEAHIAYKAGHEVAIRKAIEAAHENNLVNKKILLQQALLYEAFATHFLTDSFSAGHARVPRKRLWQLGKQDFFNNKLLNYLVKTQHDEDGEKGKSLSSTPNSVYNFPIQAWRYRLMKLRDQYEYIIYWSETDQLFIVEVPQLAGCMAHGKTQEAALKSAKQAAQLWLSTAKKLHREIPQPKGERLVFA